MADAAKQAVDTVNDAAAEVTKTMADTNLNQSASGGDAKQLLDEETGEMVSKTERKNSRNKPFPQTPGFK